MDIKNGYAVKGGTGIPARDSRGQECPRHLPADNAFQDAMRNMLARLERTVAEMPDDPPPPPPPKPLDMEGAIALARKRLAGAGWDAAVAGEADTVLICKAFAMGLLAAPRRGVLLAGGVGCGKTMAALALYPAARFLRLSDPDTVEGLEEYEPSEAERSAKGFTVLDDLGAEPPVKFRKDKDFAGDWIVRRHVCWQRGGMGAVAVTTNLTRGELLVKYGERVVSRLMEMVVPVEISGGDHRKRLTI